MSTSNYFLISISPSPGRDSGLEAGSSHTCFQSPLWSCPLSSGATKDPARRMAQDGMWLRKTVLVIVYTPSQAGRVHLRMPAATENPASGFPQTWE